VSGRKVRHNNTPMNVHSTGLALAALMFSYQQVPNTNRPPQSQNPSEPMYELERLSKLEDLTARPVYVLASKDAQIEAARDGKLADRVTVDISDLLIDTTTYRVDWAVLSVGGFLGIGAKHVLVPYSSLDWRPDSNAFALFVTKDQLKLLPEFDASKAVKSGIDEVVLTCHASATAAGFVCPAHSQRNGTVRVQDAKGGIAPSANTEQIEGTAFVRVPQGYVLSSHLQSVDVYALGDDAGSVQFIAVDPTTGAIPFAVINTGGVLGIGENHLLVPTNRLTLVHSLADENDDQGHWCIQLSRDVLNQAPKYTKPEDGITDLKGWDLSKAFFKEACAQHAKPMLRPVAPSGAGA
jgi:PRC-barrel domain